MPSYYARTLYTGNGSQKAYTINWDPDSGHYIATSDVYATLDGIPATNFSVVGNTVTFNAAPASGVAIIIYRSTSLAIIEQFLRLGTPSSGGFNNVMRRLQYIGQELLDIGASTAEAAYSALLAGRWAILLNETVDGSDYSAKEHATGATVPTGSAKAWAMSATKPDGVNESAKTYAGQAGTSATDALNSAAAASASAATAAAVAAGLSNKTSCKAATVATLNATYSNGSSGVGATLTNASTLAAFSVDGVSPTVGQRVLVKNQSTPAQNGIYTLTTVGSGAVAWVLTRATDYDTAAEVIEGTFTIIEAGTVNAGTLQIMTQSSAVTIGTTAINWTALSVSTIAATVSDALTGTSTNAVITPDALAALWERGTDIASASTLTIPSTGGGYFIVTGTTTVTAISDANTPRNGRLVRLRFSGVLTFTHNATSLILPGNANITTAAGDAATMVTEDGTNWRCVAYHRADGTPIVGSSVFTKSFVSSQQTITNGGTLTFAHGLGTTPQLVSLQLINQTGELGYGSGDIVSIINSPSTSANVGVTAMADGTNVYIQYGSAGIAINKRSATAGDGAAITNANWRLRVRAWA